MDRKTSIYSTILIILLIGSSYLVYINFHSKPTGSQTYRLQNAFPNIQFETPVNLLPYPGNTSTLYVVSQKGIIYSFSDSPTATKLHVELDLSNIVNYGGEMGLLSMAFHPNFDATRKIYVDYVAANPLRTIITEYSYKDDNIDPTSARILLTVDQPYQNHNGGQLAFGPDGFLYAGFGDGGSGGDPHGNGQNLQTLLGSIIRIDVDSSANNLEYGIPSSNPFVNESNARPEIYAYGLRNPWRFSFDQVTGKLWVGDVGQNMYEEVDIIKIGGNYGWNIMEGLHCYQSSAGCNKTSLELPVFEYDHSLGNAITGGFVYRGTNFPELDGSYIFGDYGSGRIWALSYNTTTSGYKAKLLFDSTVVIPAFGFTKSNELLVLSFDGNIYKFS